MKGFNNTLLDCASNLVVEYFILDLKLCELGILIGKFCFKRERVALKIFYPNMSNINKIRYRYLVGYHQSEKMKPIMESKNGGGTL